MHLYLKFIFLDYYLKRLESLAFLALHQSFDTNILFLSSILFKIYSNIMIRAKINEQGKIPRCIFGI